jgi:hypothetical protein
VKIGLSRLLVVGALTAVVVVLPAAIQARSPSIGGTDLVAGVDDASQIWFNFPAEGR